MIWEASDPYLYLRSTMDGRLVVGGEDEKLDDAQKRDALTAQKIFALQRKTKALLTWLDTEADYAWAGTFGKSETGLPTIGRCRECAIAMPCSGMAATASRSAIWPPNSCAATCLEIPIQMPCISHSRASTA